jgi:hypothetical protein
MKNGQEKIVWIWFFIGLIFLGAGSIDETIGCIDRTPYD